MITPWRGRSLASVRPALPMARRARSECQSTRIPDTLQTESASAPTGQDYWEPAGLKAAI
jgi:hypothetical protein